MISGSNTTNDISLVILESLGRYGGSSGAAGGTAGVAAISPVHFQPCAIDGTIGITMSALLVAQERATIDDFTAATTTTPFTFV